MKKFTLYIAAAISLAACNNDKKNTTAADETTIKNGEPKTDDPPPSPTDYTPAYNLTYTVDGTEIKNGASILVQKDKDKLKAGAPYMVMLTSNAAKNNNEYLTVNFLMDTKPGTYPVVGMSLNRGKDDATEMYGGLLGGKPQLTSYNVTVTECSDLGSNNMGGHKWSISGSWEELLIKANGITQMDPNKKHPADVKLGKGSFSNLSFDDNWEEMMEKMMKK
jgi:hypothetical protein